jgi:hypothetical protein
MISTFLETGKETALMTRMAGETVTRTLAELKKRQLLQVKGSTLHVRNKAARKTPTQTPSEANQSGSRTSSEGG